MDNVALSLYHVYCDLQNSVSRFEKEINLDKSNSILHNGINGKRIKVGLCGQYSAGKTTLLSRLFSDYAGAISSAPKTACLTIHRLDIFDGMTIKFKENFSVKTEDEQNFLKFLDDNKLEKYVHQVSDSGWESCQEEEVSPDYRVQDRKRFMETVNDYMYAIEKIYWCHKKKKTDDNNVLDFLEVYDLPGFGGKEDHEDIIRNIIETERFDIMMCLVETEQGTPTKIDIETLNGLAPILEKNNPELIFHWVYEKPSDEIDLDSKLDYINNAIAGKLDNEFFEKANLLDFTGEKDDSEIPQNVLAKQVLSVYFQKIGVEYLKSQSIFWDKEKEKVPKLQLQPLLNKIDEESRIGAVSRERVETIFEEMLQLDFSISKESLLGKSSIVKLKKKVKSLLSKNTEKPSFDGFELSEDKRRQLYIASQMEQIKKTCQSIIDYICAFSSTKVDINKLRPPYFPNKYRKEKDWILLLDRISNYRTLKDYESIGQFFLSGIGTDIYRDIKQSVNKINQIISDEQIIVCRDNSYRNYEPAEKTNDSEVTVKYECFDTVEVNDSALTVVSKEDLEVLRNPDNLSSVDLKQELTEYVKSVAMKIKSDIDSVNATIDMNEGNYESAINEANKTNDILSEMGM